MSRTKEGNVTANRRAGSLRSLLGALSSLAVAAGLSVGVAGAASAATGTPVAVTKYGFTSQAGDHIGQGTSAACSM